MKAYVQNGYGSTDFLSLVEREKPEPKANEILIKVKASSLNAGDYFSLMGSPWMIKLTLGFPRPKNHIPGWDVAGVVEAVGGDVKSFKPGDEVYAGCDKAFAEFVVVAEDLVSLKPENLSFEEAAAIPTAGVAALIGLRDKGELKAGQKVLINGASGGVGTYAVQIARAFGAQVSGVCSGRNSEMVKSLGAERVYDYNKEDFSQSDEKFDLLLDNVSSRSIKDLKKSLKPGGTILPNSGYGGMSYVIKAMLMKPFVKEIGAMYLAVPDKSNLGTLKELAEEGKIKPVIDKVYPFIELKEAFNYMDKEHPSGKIVISL